jgi:hypothetical protein
MLSDKKWNFEQQWSRLINKIKSEMQIKLLSYKESIFQIAWYDHIIRNWQLIMDYFFEFHENYRVARL